MTRDDILKMAREAELLNPPNDAVNWSAPLPNSDYLQRLERFASLVAATEREACAKVAEVLEIKVVLSHPARVDFDPNSVMARQIAALIRARGKDATPRPS